MKAFPLSSHSYQKNLNILVPYRDREDHLKIFLPHMRNYFLQDKLDRYINYKIFIIEQSSNSNFNKGKLLNAGFQLTRNEGDYTCFHDVDYLPIWADYSYSLEPVRLIWHGLVLREDYDRFFGAVVLFDNQVFEQVNGFPNCYWGWGPEDLELGFRCALIDKDFEKRDGTFQSLKHKHNGFISPGVHTEVARKNIEIFNKRKEDLVAHQKSDGLNSLEYEIIDKNHVFIDNYIVDNVFHYKIDIG